MSEKLISIALAASSAVFGQGYGDLATDRTGTQLAFVSSLPRTDDAAASVFAREFTGMLRKRSPTLPKRRRRTPLGAHPVLASPFNCTVAPAGAPDVSPASREVVAVGCAGLAGGLVGLYQIDVTLPGELRTGSGGYFELGCGIGSQQGDRGLLPGTSVSDTPG